MEASGGSLFLECVHRIRDKKKTAFTAFFHPKRKIQKGDFS